MSQLKRVWVFSRVPSKTEITRFVKNINDIGFTDVVFTINGNSSSETNFEIKQRSSLLEVANELVGLGISSHIMSWLRPTEAFFEDAAQQLRELFDEFTFRSLLFDIEEPWTLYEDTDDNELTLRESRIALDQRLPLKNSQNKPIKENVEAVAQMSMDRAALFLNRNWRFNNWPVPIGLTGIVYYPACVEPFFDYVDYVLPQAYKHSSNNLQSIAQKRWQKNSLPIVLGLKAYRRRRVVILDDNTTIYKEAFLNEMERNAAVAQAISKGQSEAQINALKRGAYLLPSGIANEKDALQLAIDNTESLKEPGIHEIAYWWYPSIAGTTVRTKFISGVCKNARENTKFDGSLAELEVDITDSMHKAIVGTMDMLPLDYTPMEDYFTEDTDEFSEKYETETDTENF
jgi:hypothetical protein